MLFSRYHNTQERSLFSEALGLRYKCPVNTHTHCFLMFYTIVSLILIKNLTTQFGNCILKQMCLQVFDLRSPCDPPGKQLIRRGIHPSLLMLEHKW